MAGCKVDFWSWLAGWLAVLCLVAELYTRTTEVGEIAFNSNRYTHTSGAVVCICVEMQMLVRMPYFEKDKTYLQSRA